MGMQNKVKVLTKTDKAILKELHKELRYHQTMVRVDLRALIAGREKCKEIGKQMRLIQRRIKAQ